MLDLNTILLIIPPVLTATFAYLVAQKKNFINERTNRAKIDAEIQTQALTIVRGVMNDMKDELRREIDILRNENISLKSEIQLSKQKIDSFEIQLNASDKLITTLKFEITTLQTALSLYKEENQRLKGK